MTATLSAPLTLRQDRSLDAAGRHTRYWKRERTNHRPTKINIAAEALPTGRAKLESSQIDAALAEWGIAPSSMSTKASPTCAVSWDEVSVEASCSYLQKESSGVFVDAQSLDRWDPSISLSPFASSSLKTVKIPKTSIGEQSGNEKDSGRALLIGNDDGTVSLLRALGREEDRVEVPAESPDISSSLASVSPSRSSSTISLSSRLRSPDAEQHSINLSSVKRLTPSQLSPLFAHNRSLASLATRSTASTPSAQTYSSSAANVHVEESLPASSIETNVTATGHSAHSGSSNHDAEHALEAQMAAADRNDHQHGLVGGVIERLGFSHHHSRHTASHESGSVPALSSTMLCSDSSLSPNDAPPLDQIGEVQTRKEEMPEQMPTKTTSAFNRGRFEPVYTIASIDRSPVVALRIVPVSSGIHGSHSLGLLVVQEEGFVSFWSFDDGRLLWDASVSCPTFADATDPKQESAAPVSVQLSASQPSVRPSTPLSRTSAGSLRPKSSKAELNKAAARQAGTAISRTREVVGVTLSSEVHVFRQHGKDFVAVWDKLSCTMFFLDLCIGAVVVKESVNDAHTSCIPSMLAGSNSVSNAVLGWLDSDNKVRTRPVALTNESKAEPVTVAKDSISSSCPQPYYTATLPENFSADRVYFTSERLLAIDAAGLRTFNLRNANEQKSVAGVVEIIGTSFGSEELLVRTNSGTTIIKITDTEIDIRETSDRLLHAKMYVPWNTVDGQLLSKIFALGPLKDSEGKAKESQVLLWDTQLHQTEELQVTADRVSELTCVSERVSAVLPMSLERVVVAVNGGLRVVSLASLTLGSLTPVQAQMQNSLGSDKEISLLRLAVAPRSGTRYILGATRQGDIAFWDATSLELLPSPSRCISTSPIEALILFGDEDNTIRLHGCVACISADSSVTMILLETLKTQYMLPGRGARIESLATRADEILLTYDDGKARVWDLRTQELRRSIAIDQALALVDDGKGWWSIKKISPYSPLHSGTTGVLSQLPAARDEFSASMLVDFRRAIEAASRSVGPLPGAPRSEQGPETEHTVEDEEDPLSVSTVATVSLASPAARKAINIIRPLLTAVFPFGLDSQLNKKFSVLLKLNQNGDGLSDGSAIYMGMFYTRDTLILPSRSMQEARRSWTFHSRLTTARSLICCVLLRILARIQELHNLALNLSHFIEVELHATIGPDFADLSLDQLASSLLDSNEDVQRSSRALFKSAMSRLNEARIESLCDIWQPLLPHLQPFGMTTKEEAITALSLLGNVAVERFKWMNPKLLKNIASSIGLIISAAKTTENDSGISGAEQQRLAVAVAIDLCRAGFSIWQHYFDAAEIVRSLFALSTTGVSVGGADGDQRALARKATLQIAQDNTPLFMTTLSLDILHARSAAHCAATMRLVAFMVRKRPLVLFPNLPRLAEAVVKSLDPTMTEMREAVVNAATVMIGELVSTYPTIAFHGRGQRLAVGTHEGAIIMYDLKTATRLYVIEGHRQPLNGCSFSPDGRRLITVSLAEQKLLVWKVGAGFTSFFTPGTIPRQGGTDPSGAYRSFDFNVGSSVPDNAASLTNDLLNAVQFEWHTNQRSVRVILGQAQLNISID